MTKEIISAELVTAHIAAYTRRNGYPPSQAEIAQEFGTLYRGDVGAKCAEALAKGLLRRKSANQPYVAVDVNYALPE